MGCQAKMLLQNTVSHDALFRHGLKINTNYQIERCTRQYTTGLSEKKQKNSYRWYHNKREESLRIHWMLKALGVTEFKAPDCWLNNWKKRYNLSISINFEYFTKYL